MAAYDHDDTSLVEFQLGSKQLFLLFIGLLIICAIFFFIGLRVGEDTASNVDLTFGNESQQQPATNPGEGSVNTVQLDQETEKPVREQKTARLNLNQPEAEKAKTATANRNRAAQQNKPADKPAAQPERKTAAATPKPKEKEATIQKPVTSSAEAKTIIPAGWYVQVSAPRDQKRAQDVRKSLPTQYPNLIQKAVVKGSTYFRVRIGPFTNKAAADKARQSVLGKYKDAIVTKQN